jgi:hypothetical protein
VRATFRRRRSRYAYDSDQLRQQGCERSPRGQGIVGKRNPKPEHSPRPIVFPRKRNRADLHRFKWLHIDFTLDLEQRYSCSSARS